MANYFAGYSNKEEENALELSKLNKEQLIKTITDELNQRWEGMNRLEGKYRFMIQELNEFMVFVQNEVKKSRDTDSTLGALLLRLRQVEAQPNE